MYFNSEQSLLTHQQQAGYSLLELSIVVIILGIIAVALIPGLSSIDPQRLDTAAQLYAEAIRYARSQSMQGGKLYGFKQKNAGRFIQVNSVDQSVSPWGFIQDVYHPVSKKPYLIDLDELPGMQGIRTTRQPIYRGTCSSIRRVYFDHHGAAWCLKDNNIALIEFAIEFKIGKQTRSVVLDGSSGRVTIQ